MDHAPASVAIEMPELDAHRASLKDILKEYLPQFRVIGRHPEAGIHSRFGDRRDACLAYSEYKNDRQWDLICKYLMREEDNAEARDDEEDELDNLFMKQMKLIKEHGDFVEQSRTAALAPSPSPHYIDFFRRKLIERKGSALAPNGREKSSYGKEGDPAPADLQTLVNPDVDPMETILMSTFMNPFLDFIYFPLENLIYWLSGSGKKPTDSERTIKRRSITRIAKVFSCMVATLALAAPASILDLNIDRKAKFSVMILCGLAFSTLASFLGPDSMPMYHLITTFVQAMLLFVGVSDPRSPA